MLSVTSVMSESHRTRLTTKKSNCLSIEFANPEKLCISNYEARGNDSAYCRFPRSFPAAAASIPKFRTFQRLRGLCSSQPSRYWRVAVRSHPSELLVALSWRCEWIEDQSEPWLIVERHLRPNEECPLSTLSVEASTRTCTRSSLRLR